MRTFLSLLLIQGLLGAFDTIYYHEWKARLPAQGTQVAVELKLHALRDFIYAALYLTLPWIAWHGLWALVPAGLLLLEIVITMADFTVEVATRKSMGGLYAGERITHALIGILFGAMLAYFAPVWIQWWNLETKLTSLAPGSVPSLLQFVFLFMGLAVFFSGFRDMYAALQLPFGHLPWSTKKTG